MLLAVSSKCLSSMRLSDRSASYRLVCADVHVTSGHYTTVHWNNKNSTTLDSLMKAEISNTANFTFYVLDL